MRLFKFNIIFCILICSLFSKGVHSFASDYTSSYKQNVAVADSVMSSVMNFAPLYEEIVKEYHAKLYIKGTLYVKKKNVMFRYLPTLFKTKKGVKEYIAESSSDIHYTAPRIYDQKVNAVIGTVPGGRRLEREMLDYFYVNIYSSTLLNDRLLSPLAKNGKKYYRYELDSILGEQEDLRYKIRFIPKSKSDQLVGGYLVVNADVWSVREIRFAGQSELILFENLIKMGQVGEKDEFLPTRYEFNMRFQFMGNVIDGSYLASLDYTSIVLQEKNKRLKEKTNYNLTDSYTLVCDTNSYYTDSVYFDSIRPIPLNSAERLLYQNHALRKDSVTVKPISKRKVFWGDVGDFLISDYNLNLSQVGNVRFSPIINPLMLSYSANNGISYRQDFRYNRFFKGGKLLRIVPRIGYNFTRKEFYWSGNADFEYWPQKQGAFHLNFGSGNRIYSSDVLDELKELPDSLFDFDQIHLDYFHDLFFNFHHSIEIANGLNVSAGFSAHRRKPVQSSRLVPIDPTIPLPPDIFNKVKDTYNSFAPRLRVEWTPGMYYYMNGPRKVNLRSNFPTFSADWERGIKGVFKSTGQYERIEVDLQHQIHLGLMRNIYYRFGLGAFTNSDELYFVDFVNFTRNNLPVGWNDEIGGVFQLLDRRWYNSSRNYIRAHFTYEAPFLLMKHLLKYTRYVQNERLYISALRVPHLNPYIEIGYGIGTHVFDFGVFVGSENFKYSKIGCKFTFELFSR